MKEINKNRNMLPKIETISSSDTTPNSLLLLSAVLKSQMNSHPHKVPLFYV
jgi:hypothetical protein